jgi:hypothetical protein
MRFEEPERSGLDRINTVGNGWNPGPPREGQNRIQEYMQKIDQVRWYSDGVTTHHHPMERNDWKAPSGEMRRSGRLYRYVTTISRRSKVQEDRLELTTYKQTILRLNWLTPQRKNGGHDEGPIGGKWAVSTDGGWTQHTSLWRNWEYLEGKVIYDSQRRPTTRWRNTVSGKKAG